MTAIVGLVQDGSVYIGADSAGVYGMSLTVRADTKVFRKKKYLFGFTTSFRMGQLIRYAMKLPKPRGDLDAFMAGTGLSPRRRVISALAAAERFSAGVRGPFLCLRGR